MVSFGLVCSSFVAVSRGSTGRHYFLPLGNESAPSVMVGNLLAVRPGLWGPGDVPEWLNSEIMSYLFFADPL